MYSLSNVDEMYVNVNKAVYFMKDFRMDMYFSSCFRQALALLQTKKEVATMKHASVSDQ